MGLYIVYLFIVEINKIMIILLPIIIFLKIIIFLIMCIKKFIKNILYNYEI